MNLDWKLTPRQWEVLQLMSKGLTNPEIADLLRISLGTVKAHVGGIIAELGVANRTEAAVMYRDTHTRESAAATSAQEDAPLTSLVVLPFSDHSPSQRHEYFAHGLSDELTSALSRLGGMRVVARTTAFALRQQTLTTKEIGERLQVWGLLEGSVCILEDDLRVNVQLVEAKSGYLHWSEVYRTKLVNLIQVQQQIAAALVRALEHKLVAKTPTPTHLPSFEAYQQYLLGLSYWHQRSPAGIAQAIGCFQQVVKQDAEYTLAYVGLADAYNQIAYYSPSPPKALFEQSQQFLHRALALEPNLAEALASQGYVDMFLHRDLARAESNLLCATQANPNYTYGFGWLSILKTMQGDFAQALDYAHKGQALDPLSPGYVAHIGYIHRCMGQHDEAIAMYEQAFRNDIKDPKSLFPYALSLIDSGQRDKAKAVATALLDGHRELPAVQGAYATIVALCGDAAEAREILAVLSAQQPERYLAPIGFAWMHVGLGDDDAAVRALRRAVAECNPMSMFIGVDPSFAKLGRHAEFPELLRQIGVDTNGRTMSG